jgi:hypothetical protein
MLPLDHRRRSVEAIMVGLAAGIAILAIAIAGAVFSVNGRRFGRRVAREARALLVAEGPPHTLDPRRLEDLPGPVRRYLQKAVGGRTHAVRTVRLRHGGMLRPKLDGGWLPIRGEQYFRTDPPGFVWWGRVPVAPGLWIDARDRSVNGSGHMLVTLESSFTLADSDGPAIDQGALVRLFGEMAWFPTALLDERYVRWEAMDERRARASLRVGGHEVESVCEFGEDGLLARFLADRDRDVGGGRAERTPFSGACRDYREVEGMLVPHGMEAAWHVGGERMPYARFLVEAIEFDPAGPYGARTPREAAVGPADERR